MLLRMLRTVLLSWCSLPIPRKRSAVVFAPKQTSYVCTLPCQAGYVTRGQLCTGEPWWLAVPPVSYRWALIGSYHDRLGHSGVSQTLAFVRQNFHWPGPKADIIAFLRQCHACQVRRLEVQDVAHVGLPRMSGPFELVHIDLAGPFELRAVSAPRAARNMSPLALPCKHVLVGRAMLPSLLTISRKQRNLHS